MQRFIHITAVLACIALPCQAATPTPSPPTAPTSPAPAPVSVPKPAPIISSKPALVTVPKPTAEGLLGEPVVDTAGAKVGTVVNVLVDPFGQPQAAVIQFEGFLGVGNREVALAWNALRFSLHGNDIIITVTVDANKLKALPQYVADAPTVPLATQAHVAPVAAAPAGNAGPAGKTAP